MKLGFEVLRFFLVADPGGKGVEVVADLGAEDDVVALALEGLGHDLLVGAGAVLVCGVEEVDSEVQGLVDEVDGLLFVDVAPPVADEGPCAEATFGDGEVGVGDGAVFHTGTAVPTASLMRFISEWRVSSGTTAWAPVTFMGSSSSTQEVQPP